MNLQQTLGLKRKLRRAWTPFFGQFGAFLPSQMAAIPQILECKNVFLSAATASGKTEALVAPLAELMAGNDRNGLSLVYVAPTRALVNDVGKRIKPPLEEMSLSCRIRTGERPEFKESAPSRVVVTTPESFDSILTRRPDLFESVKAVVLDELHLLDKTYRGDQVRLILRRLVRAAQSPVQICGASATLDDAQAMAARYAQDPVLVEVQGSRAIDEKYFPSLADIASTLVSEARVRKKILCFANSRKAVERYADLFRQAIPGWPVMAHHGSLSQQEREQVEAALRESPRWLCIATTTLEVGIDVGDVDAVLLLEPPWSVASLLQRIGRANRRSGTVNAMALTSEVEDRIMFEEQFTRARAGQLDHTEYQPDLSVVVQQIFAMLSAAPGGLAPSDVLEVFDGFAGQTEVQAVVDHLGTTGYLTTRIGRLYASEEVMDLGEKGKLYSNVPDSWTKAVIDDSTNQRVGEVSDAVDTVFILAGRAWRVVRFSKNEIHVTPTNAAADIATFQVHRGEGAFARYLPPALRLPTKTPWS